MSAHLRAIAATLPVVPGYTRALTPRNVDDMPPFYQARDIDRIDREHDTLLDGDLDEEAIARQDFLRRYGWGSWLSGMDRRWPARAY